VSGEGGYGNMDRRDRQDVARRCGLIDAQRQKGGVSRESWLRRRDSAVT
jgi:hypothetical protein